MEGIRKRPFHAPAAEPDRVVITKGIEVRPGVQITVVTERDPVDPISQDLSRGVYPPQYNRLLGLLQSIVPAGGRVLDLGAHVGSFSLAAAALGYEVLAVEASPRNAAVLQASIEANEFRQLRLIHAAVSDQSGTLEFFVNGPWGHVSTSKTIAGTVSVPALTAQEILDDHGWDRVDFVKIDIEGSEVAAIEGMKELLAGPDSPPLFVESNGHTLNFFGQTPETLRRSLKRHGYETFLVEPESLVPVEEGELQPICCVDLLALKKRPDATRTIRFDPPLRRGQIISRIVQAGRVNNSDERRHLARDLQRASASILSDLRVTRLIVQLRTDDDVSVRKEAEQIRLPGAISRRLAHISSKLKRISRVRLR